MMEELIIKLHALGVIKFGQFELKKEFISPIFIDFTPVLAHPEVTKEICALLWQKMEHLTFDQVCGVFPFASLFAHFLSFEHSVPLVLKKAEAKSLTRLIIGSYKTGQQCIVLKDVALWGLHTLEAVDDLEEEGLKVRDVLVLVDFELGAKKKVKARGLIFHSVMKISDILQILSDSSKIGADQYKLALDFLSTHK